MRCYLILLLALLLVGCAQPAAVPATMTPIPATVTLIPATATPLPATSTSLPSPTPLPATPLPSATPLPRYDLVLSGGTLIDGSGGPPLPNAVVIVDDGRIVAVGRAGEFAYSPDTPIRDLAGATILPGFINAHAHTRNLSDDQLRAWVRAGVTTIRDLGGALAEVTALRDRIAASGDASLPRLLVAGPIMNVPGSFSTAIYGVNERIAVVEGVEDARIETTRILDGGADLIKLAVSGRTDVNYAELSDAELVVIVETAQLRGIHVAAHVDRVVALRRAVLAGINSAVHSPRDRMPDDLIALMVQRKVGLVPTIAVYEGLARERGNLADWRRDIQPVMYDNLRRFADAGGLLALGDDYGGAPGLTLGMPREEIAHWIAAGIPPMQLIVAATSGGARMLGLDHELGRIAPGYIADILVVDGDPLSDIDALMRPMLIIHNGITVP